jgi:hypothetical protein
VEKFDSDLAGHFFQRPADFLGGVRQSVGVNVDPNVAARASHMGALFETRDRLFKLMPALRALEFDQVRFTHAVAQDSPISVAPEV